jgi:multicomponent Na+:H+ antiporter subunit B
MGNILASTINVDSSLYLLTAISTLIIIVSAGLIFAKDLLENTVMMSLFSLLLALLYLIMDAPDVAMTEIALNVCLSSCVLLNVINITGSSLKQNLVKGRVVLSSILCLLLVVILTWVGVDLIEYGGSNSALHNHVSKYYVEHIAAEIGTPSMVAGVLASYRGFDTLGETALILIAGISVLLILSRSSAHPTAK